MTNGDLSALDRTTLRTWRILNLVGWGVMGSLANLLLIALLLVIPARVWQGWSPGLLALLFGLAALFVAGAGAGTVIGAHVYRSPGLVAGITTAVLGLFTALLLIPWPYLGGIAVAMGMFSLDVVGAVVFSGRSWRRRPAALRASPVA